MFTVKEVELSNFRSHAHFVFRPDGEGITAISGANGTGKSTIVDSIAWALYGIKPSGVSSNAKFVREGTEAGEEVFVKVTLLLGKEIIQVKRTIAGKRGAVECTVSVFDEESNEFVLEAGPAVSHADPYIKKRLKMDAKGFLASILVQQKQVDSLISSSPKERAQVIEKLTGISSLTEALDKARKEERTLKKSISVFDYDPKEVENLEKEKKTLSVSNTKTKTKLDKIEEKLAKAQSDYADAKTLFDERETIFNSNAHIDKTVENNSTVISVTREELDRVLEEKEEKRKQLPSNSMRDFAQVKEELDEAKDKHQSASVTLGKVEDSISSLNEENLEFETLIAKSDYDNVEEIVGAIKKARTQKDKAESTIDELTEEITSHHANIKRTQSAINIISTGDDCPTCLQKVSEVSEVVESLENDISEREKKITQLEKKKTTAEKKLAELEESLTTLQNLEEAFENLEKNRTTLEKRSEQKTKAENAILSLAKDIEMLSKEYSKGERYDVVKREYDRILERSVSLSDKIEKLQKDNDKLESSRSGAKVSQTQLTNARNKVDSLNITIQDLLVKVGELRQEYKLSESRLDFIDENIERLEKEAERYQNLLESVEVASATTELVQEFRENRIKTSIPVVESYASDFLNRFTEGKFTSLTLDEKFNTTVVLANGNTRPVGLLSGGELSAAALSLRLAISMLLNSNSQNSTIILDEVLVSQDNTRSELILSSIKDSLNGQVIMISHGATTNSIADKVIELEA